MLNIVLFGPPGAGKGVQSQQLINSYALTHIAPGNIFRKHVQQKTPLGKSLHHHISQGDLVPGEIVIGVVDKELEATKKKSSGWLFDGYPRSIEQVVALDEQLALLRQKLNLVLIIDVDSEEIIKRLLVRHTIEHREDDTRERIIHRLDLYHHYSEPIISYYQTHHHLVRIDGIGTPESVNERIANAIHHCLSKETFNIL